MYKGITTERPDTLLLRINEMFNEIIDWNNAWTAYESTQKGKPKFKKHAIQFALNPESNLKSLIDEVSAGDYEPKGYAEFTVQEPKVRVIFAPNYRDKIVHHMVNNVLRNYFEPLYIRDSYACIRGKGQLACISAIQKHMRVAARNMKSPYIIKADISKFFYSIDRGILKSILRKRVSCAKTNNLLSRIIDSSPSEKGLPLGNLTSQQFANIYLNEIDQYCKRQLSLKHYIRYADDFCIIVDGKGKAAEVLKNLRIQVKRRLGLDIPVRKCILKPLRMGFHGLGVKIYTTHISLTSRTKRRTDRYFRNLSKYGTERNSRVCSSTYAYIKNFKSKYFVISLLSRYGNICYIPNKNTVKRTNQ